MEKENFKSNPISFRCHILFVAMVLGKYLK